jgi:hypothetical protein
MSDMCSKERLSLSIEKIKKFSTLVRHVSYECLTGVRHCCEECQSK